jgi:hypothetical protein
MGLYSKNKANWKTILFKSRIPIKVILKYKVKNQEVERIKEVLSICIWEKVKGRKSDFGWERIL